MAIALIAGYGLITQKDAMLWVAVVAAPLSLLVAAGSVNNAGARTPAPEPREPIPGTTLDLGATECLPHDEQ